MNRLQPFELLIRSPNWLGDACMAFPMVRAIKRGRPDLQITVIGPDKLEELWLSMPEVTRYIAKPAKEGLSLPSPSASRPPASISTLRALHELHPQHARNLARGHSAPRRLPWLVAIKNAHQIIKEPAPGGPIEHHAHRYMRLAAESGPTSIKTAFGMRRRRFLMMA
jgi:heptosyltransferase-2